jgi:hypothetical protein
VNDESLYEAQYYNGDALQLSGGSWSAHDDNDCGDDDDNNDDFAAASAGDDVGGTGADGGDRENESDKKKGVKRAILHEDSPVFTAAPISDMQQLQHPGEARDRGGSNSANIKIAIDWSNKNKRPKLRQLQVPRMNILLIAVGTRCVCVFVLVFLLFFLFFSVSWCQKPFSVVFLSYLCHPFFLPLLHFLF